MSSPNINISNLDARYSKPADVAAAISAQAVTDAGQYTPLPKNVVNPLTGWIHVDGFGADKTGTNDSTTAINNALAYAAANAAGTVPYIYNPDTTNFSIGPTVYFPPGTYKVTATITKPVGINIRAAESAIIRAAGSSAWSSPLLNSTNGTGTMDTGTSVVGGIWDCNFLAQDAFVFPYFAQMYFRELRIYNPVRHFFILGDTTATSSSYEAIMSNVDTRRSRGHNPPTGSYGIWMKNCSDSKLNQVVINGADIGFHTDLSGHTLTHVHVWNYGGTNSPSTCFEDNTTYSANAYIGCYADTPGLYGFNLIGGWGVLTNCQVYGNSNSFTDNTATGVNVGGSQGLATIIGLSVIGGDSTHRFKADISGNNLYTTVLGTRNVNVITETAASGRANLPWIRLSNPGGGSDMTFAKQTNSNATNFIQMLNSSSTVMAKITASGEFAGNGHAQAIVSKSANYTMTATDGTILASGTITITLPTVASIPAGRIYTIKNINSGTVTVAPQGVSTLDAGGSLSGAGAKGWYQTDGTNWYQIG